MSQIISLTHTHTPVAVCFLCDLAQLKFGSGAGPRSWRKSVVIRHDWKTRVFAVRVVPVWSPPSVGVRLFMVGASAVAAACPA